MKAVILAGGLGSRLSEETDKMPKPMIEIGGKPILWHIMKLYSNHGINDFIICAGYKGYMIKEYFKNYFYHMSDVTYNLNDNTHQIHNTSAEPWKVTVVDTGEFTQTGGRLKKVASFLGDEDFCFTYGDGVGNINITKLLQFHTNHGKLATLTATRPPGRFGALTLNGSSVETFKEKPAGDGTWVNGGFFVLSPKVLNLIKSEDCIWEREPMESLAKSNQFEAHFHDGFWQPMDNLRDKRLLEELWVSGKAPWLEKES